MKRTKLEREDSRSPASIIALIVIFLYSASLLGLFLWGVLSSLKSRLDFRSNLFGLPKVWMFENYINAFKELVVPIAVGEGTRNVYLPEMIFNSLLTSVIPIVINVFTTSICAYTLAKYRFRCNGLIYNVLIIVMVLPIVGNLPSQLQFQRSLGVYDKIWWLCLTAGTVWTGNWLILHAIYKSISWEFAEAAFIDGAGHHAVYWRIMLPLSRTTILVLCLLGFITNWNDYQLSLIYLPSWPTLAYGLYDFQFSKAQIASAVTIQLSASILSALPSFALFMIFKNKMMGALTMGGLKG